MELIHVIVNWITFIWTAVCFLGMACIIYEQTKKWIVRKTQRTTHLD